MTMRIPLKGTALILARLVAPVKRERKDVMDKLHWPNRGGIRRAGCPSSRETGPAELHSNRDVMDFERNRRKQGPPPSDGFIIPSFSDVVEIARGGFGIVYRAQQPAYRRTVAIKVLQASLDGKTKERFERECMALGTLSGHPNIVTLFDSGFTPRGEPYIVMEYLAGGSLEERVTRSGPMRWGEAVEIGIKLAGALHTAHQAGVLHRDLKPRNVLVSSFGETRLVDFGLARLKGAMETRMGDIAASLAFAAPEILTGEAPSVASDLYSLAATLFTVMSGRPPFVRSDDDLEVQVLGRIASAPVPDLRPSGVPESVCQVLERAMAKEPARRFQSAEEFGKALQAAQAEAGILVTPLPLKKDVEDWATNGPTPAEAPPADGTARRGLEERWGRSAGDRSRVSSPPPSDHSVTDRTVVRPPVGAPEGWSPPPSPPPPPGGGRGWAPPPPGRPPAPLADRPLPPVTPSYQSRPAPKEEARRGFESVRERVSGRPLVIAAAAGVLVLLLLVAWLIFVGGGDDSGLGPSDAAQEGRYRYRRVLSGDVPTTRPGAPTGDTIATVATSSRSVDETRQSITFEDPEGTAERVVRMWRKDGLYEDETVRIVDGRENVCDWQPDVLLVKFPVTRGARWTVEVSCRDAAGIVVERVVDSRVTGSSNVKVQGQSVRVWTIDRTEKRRLLQSGRLLATQDVTTKELFAPGEGMFVRVQSDFKTTPSPGTASSQLSFEYNLLDRKPV